MSEFDHTPDGFPADLGAMVGRAMNQMRATIEDMTAERFEYRRVPWAQVNDLARQGWLLVPVEGGYDVPAYEPLFVMSRKLGPADDAEQMLAEHESTPS